MNTLKKLQQLLGIDTKLTARVKELEATIARLQSAGPLVDKVTKRLEALENKETSDDPEINYEELAGKICYSSVESELSYSDLRDEIDLTNIADYVDTADVANNLDPYDIAQSMDIDDVGDNVANNSSLADAVSGAVIDKLVEALNK